MFKAIREFFLGKPAQAPEVVVPYKVEPAPAPAPVEFTPPPKAADVVVEAPVPAVTNGVGNVPLGNGSSAVTDSLLSVKPAPAPAKKPAARRRPANAKKAPAKKPVAK
jgi:hypothetical protein